MGNKEKIIATIEKLDTEEVKNLITMLGNDFQEGSTSVFICALDILETRIPESEYIAFCDTL